MTAEEAKALDVSATDFADQLTALTRGVLGEDTPRFHAINMGSKIRVSPIREDEVLQRIPVSIGGEQRLSLMVRFYCCWDGSSTFMATDQADVHVFYAGSPDPLFRFEYVRRSKEPPGAHVQVHAHRDEVAYLLRLAEKGRPKQKFDRLPRLAELLFLKREFAIDTVDGWKAVIDEHLRSWRLTQLKTAVRDAPDSAAQVLRSLGYTVVEPLVPGARQASDEVKLFWP
ncbi:hypothetical protein [Streptomyces anulatus]|uniref:hypothetical protein n=1 Tax=Streptomyces anulatus TaxID=1892 RepID=UPI00225A3ABB|nr:hypothetical protein [Streptomyces anulatus]MCX4503341.1 hypothetical protein [Streptomyces anulatus]